MTRRIASLQFLDVCSPPLAEVFRYWDGKRGGRAMPLRAEIDPNELRRHLPGITLVDVKREPLDFVYRLIGTREVAARGYDPTGRRVAENWFGANSQDVVSNYERVVASRSFLYDKEAFTKPDGRRVVDESLFLPLALPEDEAAVAQIMVYSHYGDSWAGSRPSARKLLPVLDE